MLTKLVKQTHARPDGLTHVLVSLLSPGVFSPPTAECPVHSLDIMRGRLPRPAALMRLARVTNRIRPDILQGWMYHGNLAASLAAMVRPERIPVMWNVRHSLADPAVESRATRALLTVSARLSSRTSAILYNSRTAARQHEAYGFDADRSVHIPNGFDCEVYRPDPARRAMLSAEFGVPNDQICVAMIGRCHPMKDHALLVEAVGLAIAGGQDLHLLLVGPGLDAPPPELQSKIDSLPPNRVTVLAGRTDVARWLPGIDILALSSAWGEAFPNILGEAMACGVPCVTTDVGDSGWIVGESGIVAPPRDLQAFAAGISHLSGCSRDERLRRGLVGRARIKDNFEVGEIARRYRQLYLSTLQRRGGFVRSATNSHADTHAVVQ